MLRPRLDIGKTRATLALTTIFSFLSLSGCTQSTADTHEADAKILRELDDQWSKTAGAKDLDGTVGFYTDDAVVMPGDAPIANTKQTIRAARAPMLAPNAMVSWQAKEAEMARSGDMGYARGVYQLVMKDAAGKATTEQGKFLEIWKKQADGKWKCTVDSFSANAPAGPAK